MWLSSNYYFTTRLSETYNSSSLIDNIFLNKVSKCNTAGILIDKLSDHQILFICQNENFIQKEKHTYIEIEAQSNANISSLKRDLKDFDIYSKLYKDVNTDPNINYELFSKCVCSTSMKDKWIPRKKVKFNKRKHRKCQ